MSLLCSTHRSRSLQRGFSLVEMVISIALISVLLITALNLVGATRLGEHVVNNGRRGHQLAEDLMSEILPQDYADATLLDDLKTKILIKGAIVSAALGPEPGEDTGDRSLFDDVDDYHGWSASPPQAQDGTKMSHLAGWQREVVVQYVNVGHMPILKLDDDGAKLITITVSRNGAPAAELVALRTIGPPPTEACCLKDGTCIDLTPNVCATLGGETQGPDTNCFTNSCARGSAPTLLLVVTDDSNPTAQELARQALIESWDYQVTLIADGALQADFDAAVANADVTYIAEDVDESALGTKLRNAPIGVVNENTLSNIDLGLSSQTANPKTTTIVILDNSHYITSTFSLGALAIGPAQVRLIGLGGNLPPDISILAEIAATGTDPPTLGTLMPGDSLEGGGVAAGRRVQLPWGGDDFDINMLNADGLTIMQRAIEWAAEVAGGGGAPGEMHVNDIAMGWRKADRTYYGQAAIWVKDDAGADVAGATVTVQWSGASSGSAEGVTGADGRVMLESPRKWYGGTFICTVTNVLKSGSTYNAALNVETSDSITAP